LLPLSELAIGLVNVAVTTLIRPKALPKLEFGDRLPPHCRTLVVIPGLLTSPVAIRTLLERLEIHYLPNPEHGLQFAVLIDFADASASEIADDAEMLERARAGIRDLNGQYSGGGEAERFHLLHRQRRWNPVQNAWMGWERKRGKLEELNRILRGSTDT